MKIEEIDVKLNMENVYGGDGFTYIDTIDEVSLNQSKKTVTVRRDIGIPISTVKEKRETKKTEVAVNTFKRDEKGKPLLRLGGTHGKFWGAMKRAGMKMYDYGEIKKIDVIRIMDSVLIEPEWVELELNGCKIQREQMPQILNTRSYETTQVIMHYDFIPRCSATFTMKYPKLYEKQIVQMLDLLQTTTHFNKRRTKVTIVS